MLFGKSKWDPKDLHVYITGGSEGLGLSTALLLAKKGANISIVARRQEKLDKALKAIEAARVSPSQKFAAHSFSLHTYPESLKALETVCASYEGRAPDAVFNCAGASRPKYFVDMTEEDLKTGMDNGYWVEAWTAFAVAKMMIRQRKTGGRIVFIGSTLSYMSFLGYTSYSPAKHALRGLVDTLDSELKNYGISVHCFFAPTMHTPGYEEEMKTKPPETKKIEEDDTPLNPEQAAAILVKGIEQNKVHISGNLITDLFRASTRGSAKPQNWLLDPLFDFIGFIGIPIWRLSADATIKKGREAHLKDLEAKGFFE